MGWQESRVSLVPPGWREVVELSPTARTFGGVPVRIIRVERVTNGRAEGLDPGAVREWLAAHGFRVVEQYRTSVTFGRDDILADLYEKDGELAHLSLTFTLSRDAPSRLGKWQAFVTEMCEAWGLKLGDSPRGRLVGPEDLPRLLSETVSWQDFQRNFGWPPVTSAAQ